MKIHKQRTFEEKKQIVEEILKGRTYSAVSKEYDVLPGTIASWKKRYLEGRLEQDNRGKKIEEIEDVEILKKSYALLMKIRNTRHK